MAASNTIKPLISMVELEQLQLQILEQRDRCRVGTTPDIGPILSRWRGQGMEQTDTRPYHPGDDIRHIDWRATARSGKTIGKIFSTERGRQLILIIDRRTGMFFGTRKELKATTAARITAMLSFSALNAREPITALVFDDTIQSFPTMRNTNQLLPLLASVSAGLLSIPAAQQAGLSIKKIIKQALALYEPGTSLCIISDFYDVDDNDTALWGMLGRHFDVTTLRVIDSAEEHLSKTGLLRVRSPHNGKTLVIDSSNPQIRQHYAATAAQVTQRYKLFFSQNNIHFITLQTHDDLFARLQSLL